MWSFGYHPGRKLSLISVSVLTRRVTRSKTATQGDRISDYDGVNGSKHQSTQKLTNIYIGAKPYRSVIGALVLKIEKLLTGATDQHESAVRIV